MKQALNYCTLAKAYFDRLPASRIRKDFKVLFSGLSNYIDEAQKFMLPESGRFFEEKNPIFSWEYAPVTMPYPVTALEYPTRKSIVINPEDEKHKTINVPKRIILVIHRKALGIDKPFEKFILDYVNTTIENCEQYGLADDFVVMWPIGGLDDGSWNLLASGVILPGGLNGLSPLKTKTMTPVFMGEYLWDAARSEMGKEEFYNIFKRHVGPELIVLKQFCETYACENITITAAPINTKLVKKWQKKKQMKLYSYHVLTLNHTQYTRKPKQSDITRTSPRFHFRRGHKRILSPTRSIFVQSCTVGRGPGIVDKDYLV